jgi:hypothetical protein
VALRVVQTVVVGVPERRDDGRVGVVGQAEVAAGQVDRRRRGGAELVGDLLGAAEVAAGDGDRQVRVLPAKLSRGVGSGLAGAAEDEYRAHGSPLATFCRLHLVG